jgi:hypothetical protein
MLADGTLNQTFCSEAYSHVPRAARYWLQQALLQLQ